MSQRENYHHPRRTPPVAEAAHLRGALSVKESADYLNVSRRHFYNLIANDEIDTFKSGNRRLVTVRALHVYMEDQEAAAAEARS